LIIVIKSNFLLLHDGLFVFDAVHTFPNFLQLIILVYQNCLLLNPFPIQLITLLLQFLTFPQQINKFIFFWIFALIISLTHKFIMQFIESTNLMLFLLINIMSLLDLHFISNNQILLIILLSQSLIFLLLQQLNLRLGIQLINFNSGYLIQNVFILNFFLLNILTYFMSLFQ